MELFETKDHYIILDGDFSLWCNRKDGRLTPKRGSELTSAWNPICLGQISGVIGKIQVHSANPEKLILVSQQSLVGCLPGKHEVYMIRQISILPLSEKSTPNLGIERCKKHHFGLRSVDRISGSPQMHQKSWNAIKTATAQVKVRKDGKDRDRFDRRITAELEKMFNETNSFYYSPTGDLTNSIQRQCSQREDKFQSSVPIWQRVDDRFFWNQSMLKELIESNNPFANHWIMPVIQGFVQMELCCLEFRDEQTGNDLAESHKPDALPYAVNLMLISRRSRYRAGTRYRRRGIDEMGKCANYVETEQIVEYGHHVLSFVQVRGSVPLYWSQPGYKYRPPPQLDKDEEETQVAFKKHFAEELDIYGSQTIVNLVEQSGKEKIIADAYLNHILNYNSPFLTFVIFDFHEYCRGMRFENVSLLVSGIMDIIKEMGYCWMDKQGFIFKQMGVFRVNCIDCLDRTNVVQMALAKVMLEMQFHKLGILPPEGVIPPASKTLFQTMWANNGDIISRQYAGTAALKGDYTRTGERRFAGMMKDGYNSANRYFLNLFEDAYRQAGISVMLGEPVPEECEVERMQSGAFLQWFLPSTPRPEFLSDFGLGPEGHLIRAAWELSRYYVNRFRDAYRQATIDLMLGQSVGEEILALTPERESDDDSNWQLNQAEHIRQLIEDCKKILIPNSESVVGGWALIDADPVTGDPNQHDADTILVLTKDSYYVAEYDDETDRISRYQRVMLEDVENIELGPEPSLFKSKFHCVRISYQVSGQTGYFHMFRSSVYRFFNNMAVLIMTEEEAVESMKVICDTFLGALAVTSRKVPFYQGKLARKRSKMPFAQGRPSSIGGLYLDLPSLANIPRNVSEGQLLALKNVGSKALSNMTSQFAKLNPMGLKTSFSLHKPSKSSKSSVEVHRHDQSQKKAVFHTVSSSESDEEVRFEMKDFHQNNQQGSSCLGLAMDREGEEEVLTIDDHSPQDVLLSSCGILATGRSSFRASLGQETEKESVCTDSPYSIEHYDVKGCWIMGSTSIEDTQSGSSCNQQGEAAHSRKCSEHLPMPKIQISRDDSMGTLTGATSFPPEMYQSLNSLGLESFAHKDVGDSLCYTSEGRQTNPQDSISKVESLGTLKLSRSEGAIESVAILNTVPQRAGSCSPGNQGSPLSSPLAIRKDLVMVPFTKIARGVQNFGINLRNASIKQGRTGTSPDLEADRRLQEKRVNCRTRIVQI